MKDVKLINKTALFDKHVQLNAKVITFANYKMPVSYSEGIVAEYFSIRKDVGMFDISHMGEFQIYGQGALEFLQKVTINDVSKLKIGEAQYSAMCFENGGIIDDLILYRRSNNYLMVVYVSRLFPNPYSKQLGIDVVKSGLMRVICHYLQDFI